MDLVARVVARYQGVKVAGKYHSVMVDLVSRIDDLRDPDKIKQDRERVLKLGEMISADEEWHASPAAQGLAAHAVVQRTEDLAEALYELAFVTRRVQESYDDMNETFLRLGLK